MTELSPAYWAWKRALDEVWRKAEEIGRAPLPEDLPKCPPEVEREIENLVLQKGHA